MNKEDQDIIRDQIKLLENRIDLMESEIKHCKRVICILQIGDKANKRKLEMFNDV